MNDNSLTIGAFEAKTHLSELLKRVANGDSITITNRGKAVARLVPCQNESAEGRAKAIKGLSGIRKKIKGYVDIRSFIEEGRKY